MKKREKSRPKREKSRLEIIHYKLTMQYEQQQNTVMSLVIKIDSVMKSSSIPKEPTKRKTLQESIVNKEKDDVAVSANIYIMMMPPGMESHIIAILEGGLS